MEITEILNKAREFDKNGEQKKKVENALRKLEQFLSLYPFRKSPEQIDLLTPEKLYNPGAGDYFFTWIEHKLKDLGHLRIGSAMIWENARDNVGLFKELLKKAVDDSLTILEKIDANWEDIKFFGGDKNAAKKIIWCYNSENLLPIFKTEDLEHFAKNIELDYKRESLKTKGEEYEGLSVGDKFELQNKFLLDFKNRYSEFENWKNPYFTRFLYEILQPEHMAYPAVRTESKALQSLGLLFEPRNEQELVYLFAKFHQDLGFPYIIKISSEFPDAEVMNKNRERKTIEFELFASNFKQHGHDRLKCDFIVCWEDNLQEEVPEKFPEIIAIKDLIENLK